MRQQRRYAGQSLVEFALVFPILFLLVTGFFDLGRAVFYYSSLSNSVREGTRYAIVHEETINEVADNDDYLLLQQKVEEFSFGFNPSDIDVDVIVNLDENDRRESVSITATYMFTPITPGIKQIFGAKTGIPITTQSTMRIAGIAR
jgi:hypothetical protein